MDPDPELVCVKCTVFKLDPTTSTPASPAVAEQKIRAPLLELLKMGKLANVVISFEDPSQNGQSTDCDGQEEGAETVQQETSELLEKSMAEVIDILYGQKDRLPFTLKLMYDTNRILVNRADFKLVKDVAAVEHVADVDGEEVSIKAKRTAWNKFKNVWRLKK